MSGSALQLETIVSRPTVADREANALLVWRGSYHDHAGESAAGIRKPCGRHAPGSADFTHANGVNNAGDVVGGHGCPGKLGCSKPPDRKALADGYSLNRSAWRPFLSQPAGDLGDQELQPIGILVSSGR